MGIRRMNTKKKKSFRAEIRVKGQRYSRNFQSEEAAQAWINGHQVLKLAHSGSNQHERKMTLGQAFVISLETAKRRGLEQHALDTYEWQLRYFQKIVDINIPDLKAEDFTSCFKSIRKMQGGAIPSKSTLSGILNRLIETIDMAARKGFFVDDFDNAIAEIKNYIKKEGKPQVMSVLYSEEEVQRLLTVNPECIIDEPHWVLPLIQVLLMTGKRFGEVIALTDSDTDFQNNTIHIYKMISARHYHEHLKAHAPEHYIQMDEQLRKVILDIQAKNKALGKTTEWLFPTTENVREKSFPVKDKCPFAGRPVTQAGAHKLIKRRMKALGLRPIKIHDFRKTYATYRLVQLLRENNPFAWEIVQRELNHKSRVMTEKYVNIPQDTLLQKVKTNPIGEMFNSNTEPNNNSEKMDEMLRSVGLVADDVDWNLLKELLLTFSKIQKKAA